MVEQLEFFEIPSPCIRVCQTDERGVCIGCFRNREERFNWLNYSNTEKREVLRLTKQRYVRLIKAKRAAKATEFASEQPPLSQSPQINLFEDQ